MKSNCRNIVVDSRRAVLLGVFALFLSAADAKSNSFCHRLAPQLNMKQSTAPASASRQPLTEWKVNLLGGLGPALFGGTAVVSLSVRPIDETVSESGQPASSCDATKKGAICNIAGPVRLTVGTKNGEVIADASAGERATVEMRGTTIFCRDGEAPR